MLTNTESHWNKYYSKDISKNEISNTQLGCEWQMQQQKRKMLLTTFFITKIGYLSSSDFTLNFIDGKMIQPRKSETNQAIKRIPSKKKKSWQINCNYVPPFSQHDEVWSVYVSASPPWPQKLTQPTNQIIYKGKVAKLDSKIQ